MNKDWISESWDLEESDLNDLLSPETAIVKLGETDQLEALLNHETEVQDLVCNRLLNNGLSPEICKGALTEIVFSKYLIASAKVSIVMLLRSCKLHRSGRPE